MVVDGAGQAWLLGRWKVIRLDPTTGETSTWDAADDAVFASPELALAPSAGAGVWLLDGDQIRLFDGHRFAVDLQVPEDMVNFRADSGAVQGIVLDAVEVGSELWLSLHLTLTTANSRGPYGGQVVKWSNGQWTAMSQLEDWAGGDLAVDSVGSVWAGGSTSSMAGALGGVKRFDGSRWVLPDASDPGAPGSSSMDSGHVVADPAGGVWFNIEGQGGHLFRFDGASWHSAGGELLTPDAVFGGLAATSGAGWLLGGPGIARFSADGTVRTFGPEQASLQDIASLAVAPGDALLLLDRVGVQRLDGDQFTRLWTDPDQSTSFTIGRWVARSADEVLAQSDNEWFGYHDDAWKPIGLRAPSDMAFINGPPILVASDGALWISSSKGLVRRSEGRNRVVGEEAGELFTGLDGSVWLSGDDEIVNYSADGRRMAIDWPGQSREQCLKAGGPDGSVWVGAQTRGNDGECDDPLHLFRWNGRRWAQTEAPPTQQLGALVVTDDGAAWATAEENPGISLARYADGRWMTIDTQRLGSLTAAPLGRVCGVERTDVNNSYGDAIVCFNREGEVARFDISGMGVWDISIAPDGAIWVKGDPFARLDQTLPRK